MSAVPIAMTGLLRRGSQMSLADPGSVGWHADQLTCELRCLSRKLTPDLGPYCTIASLSLGTPRAFRLRPTAAVDEAYAATTPVRTYEVTLGHNTLCLMTPGCQERYKHT